MSVPWSFPEVRSQLQRQMERMVWYSWILKLFSALISGCQGLEVGGGVNKGTGSNFIWGGGEGSISCLW